MLQILPYLTSKSLETQNNGRPAQQCQSLLSNSAGHVLLTVCNLVMICFDYTGI